jgi:hypothetical protein
LTPLIVVSLRCRLLIDAAGEDGQSSRIREGFGDDW